MKNPKQLKNLVDAFQSVRDFKYMLRNLCVDACIYPNPKSKGIWDSYMMFKYNNIDYCLRISRDDNDKKYFWLSLYNADGVLDDLYIGKVSNINKAYKRTLYLLECDVKREAEKLAKLAPIETSEAIYQQVSGFRG